MSIKEIVQLGIAICISECAGLIGSFFTVQSVSSWYSLLEKPLLNPPSWVFGPVWITLYALMGIASFLIWKRGWKKKQVKIGLGIFILQLILNTLWSVFFFGMQNPALAAVDITLLWFMILLTMSIFYKVSRPAMYLLVPYILWVTFAMYLNYSIWLLN